MVVKLRLGVHGLHVHGVVVSFLEHHVLDQFLGGDVLLHDLALLVLALAHDDALGLGGEDDAAGGDGGCGDVLGLGHAHAGESYLEDAQSGQAYLLSQFQEVLHGLSQFVQCGLDVASLQGCLALDEACDVRKRCSRRCCSSF